MLKIHYVEKSGMRERSIKPVIFLDDDITIFVKMDFAWYNYLLTVYFLISAQISACLFGTLEN